MTRLQANAVLLLTAMIWGTTFVVQQVGTGGLKTIMFTGCRTIVGALFVLPLAIRELRRLSRSGRRLGRVDWLLIVVTGCVLLTAGALQQYGIFHTTVTNAGFLTALYVPLVPIISFGLLRRRVHWSVWPASLCCLVGTWIMSGAGMVELRVGDIWVIGSSLFWACHVILVGTAAIRTGVPLVVACGQFFVCGIGGILLGLLVESPQAADFDGAVFGILYAGLLSTGVGFTLQVVGQRFTQEADAAIILSAETVFAAIAGYLFLQERVSPLEMTGAVLIFSGILAVQLLPLLRRSARPLSP